MERAIYYFIFIGRVGARDESKNVVLSCNSSFYMLLEMAKMAIVSTTYIQQERRPQGQVGPTVKALSM